MNQTEIDLIVGVLGISLFIYRNPEKRFLYLVCFFVFGLFLSQLIHQFINPLAGNIVWLLAAFGALGTYIARLKTRPFSFLSALKFAALLLLVIYTSAFDLILHGDVTMFVIENVTFTILGVIYIYDRFILNPEPMKKKFVAVLVVQSVMILLMLMYAIVQKAEADEARTESIEMQKKAVEMREELELLRSTTTSVEKDSTR